MQPGYPLTATLLQCYGQTVLAFPFYLKGDDFRKKKMDSESDGKVQVVKRS